MNRIVAAGKHDNLGAKKRKGVDQQSRSVHDSVDPTRAGREYLPIANAAGIRVGGATLDAQLAQRHERLEATFATRGGKLTLDYAAPVPAGATDAHDQSGIAIQAAAAAAQVGRLLGDRELGEDRCGHRMNAVRSPGARILENDDR